MNWDRESIAYSSQGQGGDTSSVMSGATDNRAMELKKAQSKFRQFLREWRKGGVSGTFVYREQLMNNYAQQNYKVIVDFEDLFKFDPQLAQEVWQKPTELISYFELAAQEVVALPMVPKPRREDMNEIQVQFVNFTRNRILIRDLGADNISQMVCIPGIVITASKVGCKATELKIRCPPCGFTKNVTCSAGFGMTNLPRKCEMMNDPKLERPCPLDPFVIMTDSCAFIDTQRLKLQEEPENIPTGEMPRHIWLSCERKLVDRVKPGSRLNVIGIYAIYQAKSKKADKENKAAAIRQSYIRVIGLEEIDANKQKGSFAPEEEEELRNISRDPDIRNKISKSIAPAIWGSDDIKRAVACLLFGGSRKITPDGMRLRGDINVLLLGDPSVAKSQFLKYVHQVAPIGIYTSGKGSSAAGLTASVIREPGTGEFHLEGGAMVLADGGVVCIDEFDKMREQDRVAIHEAMEQQTISIAKAGITTILNSRTSVLAAANPIFGRYDDLKSTADNIDFQTTILSRFDLIFIIRDVHDVARDSALAKHIMDIHINAAQEMQENTAPFEADTISKYVAYARHTCHPRLTDGASTALRNHYVRFRKDAKDREAQTGSQSAIPITVRQLEAIIRLSESLAKMELADEANEGHVAEAVRLFQVATLKAAQQGGAGENAFSNPDFSKQVQRTERHFRQRLAIGSTTSVKRIVADLARLGHEESTILKALEIMVSRGEVEYLNRRKQIRRRK